MPKLDSNIYGSDSNTLADRLSSEALNSKQGEEDVWGSALEQSAMSRGTSKGTVPETNTVVQIHPNKGSAKASKGN